MATDRRKKAKAAAKPGQGDKGDRFYVIPHRKTKAGIETRMRDILEERDPTDISRPVELEPTSPQPGRPG